MDAMHDKPHPHQDIPHGEVLALFEEPSFLQTCKRVVYGLRQPRDSGDHKFARLQLVRLSAPVAAFVSPLAVVLLLTLLTAPDPLYVSVPRIHSVDLQPVEPLRKIPQIVEPPLDPHDPIRLDIALAVPVVDAPIDELLPRPEILPAPGDLHRVVKMEGPVFVKGLLSGRIGAARRAALHEHGDGLGRLTEGAVLRCLRWLKKFQEDDGSWRLESGGVQQGKHTQGSSCAATGLGLLTFLAHGETPASDEFGPTVEKAMQYLVAAQGKDGRFPGNYDIPIATYAICEAYALTKVPILKAAAERATEVIIRGQHACGGWNYRVGGPENRNDTSYMAWCAQALKAAQMSGCENPGLKHAMVKAVEGFRLNAKAEGGFGYTGPGAGGLTGAGVLCMQLLGAGKARETRNGLNWLERVTFDWDEPWGRSPVYYWYYITQAKFHAGGDTWRDWNRKFALELVKNQVVLKEAGVGGNDIGYWAAPSETEHSHSLVYNTCLCALQLQVYYRYLPTYRPPQHLAEIRTEPGESELDVQISL